MSVEQEPNNTPNNENENYQEEGRVVIDAVHERFRRREIIMNNFCQMYIRCDDCDSKITWNDVAIRNHFNNLHPSNKHCRYCKGKVFVYKKIIIIGSNQTSDEIVYHKCDYDKQAEISA